MSKKNKSIQHYNQQNMPAVKKSGNFVTVKSKLPFGLTCVMPDGRTYVIKGMNQSKLIKVGSLFGAYESTLLDADVWSYFAKVHSQEPYIKNKIVFAETDERYANDKSLELSKDSSTKTGMEQADPNSIPGIKKADEVQQNDQGVTV